MNHGLQNVSLRQFTAYVGVCFSVYYIKYIYGNVPLIYSGIVTFPDGWLAGYCAFFWNQHQVIIIIIIFLSALDRSILW